MRKPIPKFVVGIPRTSMEWYLLGRHQMYFKLWERGCPEDVEVYLITPRKNPDSDLPKLTVRYDKDIIFLYDRKGNEVDHLAKVNLITDFSPRSFK